jgi:DNA-binding MarR family transcriptional regulator
MGAYRHREAALAVTRRRPTATLAPMPASSAEPEPLREPGGLDGWTPSGEAAWLGLMEAHRRVVRALDAGLAGSHGLGFRAYEVLARLGDRGTGRLRMTALAEQTMLSQSRVSRIVDQLERDGLVVREGCTDDTRVVFVSITDRGRELLGRARDTFFAIVERELFGRLSPRDVEQLARIWGKALRDPPGEPANGASGGRARPAPPASRRPSGRS